MSKPHPQLTRQQWHALIVNVARQFQDELIATHDVGWFDGGCYTLATALHAATEGHTKLCYVGRTKATIDHALVYVPVADCYLDADGAHTKDEMLFKMRKLEATPVTDIWPIEGFADKTIYHEIADELIEAFASHLEDLRVSSPGASLQPLDLTLLPEGVTLPEASEGELSELQREHAHGNCHALTALLCLQTKLPVKVLVSPEDAGNIPLHSFLDVGGGYGLDAMGVTPIDDILARYEHMCTPGSLRAESSSLKTLIAISSLEDIDLESAIEYWSMVQEVYDLPGVLELPGDDVDELFDRIFDYAKESADLCL